MRATICLSLGLLLVLGACTERVTPAGRALTAAATPTAAAPPTVAAPTVFSSPLTHASPLVPPTLAVERLLPFSPVARRQDVGLPPKVSDSRLYHFSVITNTDDYRRLRTDVGEVELPLDGSTVAQIRVVNYRTHFAVVVFRVEGFYPEPRLKIERVAMQGLDLVVYAEFDGTIPTVPVPAANALHYHIVAVEKAPDVEWGREILVRLNVNGKEVQEQRFFIP